MPERPGGRAVIIGATGGLGAALVHEIGQGGSYDAVRALSRSGADTLGANETGRIDLVEEESVAAAAGALRDGVPLRLVIVASGLLHAPGLTPERSLRALDPAMLARSYAVNAIGPALAAKHLLPCLPRDGRSVFAALSARVGSIGDNRLGGWHAYRAAKAALNMLLRTFAIELSRTHPEALCVGLHPGTVATPLSAPFQGNVPAEKLFAPADAAQALLGVLDGLRPEASGRVFAWDGHEVPP